MTRPPSVLEVALGAGDRQTKRVWGEKTQEAHQKPGWLAVLRERTICPLLPLLPP